MKQIYFHSELDNSVMLQHDFKAISVYHFKVSEMQNRRRKAKINTGRNKMETNNGILHELLMSVRASEHDQCAASALYIQKHIV